MTLPSLSAQLCRHTAFRTLGAIAFLVLYASSSLAQMSQTITLEPGWNSIYLEIEPDEPVIANAFDGVAIESVWRYLSLDGVTGLPSNPADGLAGIEGWRVYFPGGTPVADLTDLNILRANNAYLVNYVGAQALSLTLHGKPILQRRRWSDNAYTLTGFNVDPAFPATFQAYFAGSNAHRATPIYGLGDDGIWRLIERTEAIEPGRAYWVFTAGSSTYQGPLEVLLSPGYADLDFGVGSVGADLIPVNRSSNTQEISLSRLPSGPALPLYFKASGLLVEPVDWQPLENAFANMTLAPGEASRLEVSPRRSEMLTARQEQVLVLTTTDGVRVLIPAGMEQPNAALAARAKNAGVLPPGLWSGFATIDEVDFQSVFADPALEPRKTGQPFNLRIILHVDANGEARLVSSVVQLFEEGKRDLNGVACRDGRSVLITQREKYGDYEGLVLRGNDFVGARLSTTAYDLGQSDDGTARVYDLPMTVDTNDSNRYSLTLIHGSNEASNPFYHRFHPDHDNLDVNGLEPDVPEVPLLERRLSLQFCPSSDLSDVCSNAGVADPAARLAGTFVDVIARGLHDRPLMSRGTFDLQRITADPNLNPDALADCP